MNLTRHGDLFDIELSHQEVQDMNAVLQLLPAEIATVVAPVVGLVSQIDRLGGNTGVHITGIIPLAGCIITPRSWTIFDKFHAILGNVPLTGMGTICEFIIEALRRDLLVVVLFGVQIAVLKRVIGGIFGSDNGEVHADEGSVGHQERFLMAAVRDKITILSHQGYFCADANKGNRVFADRGVAAGWEEFSMETHADGRVSFKAHNGQYVCADQNTNDTELWASRPRAGGWEKFTVEQVGDGVIALKDDRGDYVSVAG